MKCVRCGKAMDKAAAWVGSYPIGPKCLEKMDGKRLAVHSKVKVSEQSDLFGETMSYAQTEMKIIQWAESRKVIPNATSSTQLIKVFSELGECGDELIKGNRKAMQMELGDVMVTLVIFAALEGLDLCECMDMAYEKIKNRQGTMLANGVFVKDES